MVIGLYTCIFLVLNAEYALCKSISRTRTHDFRPLAVTVLKPASNIILRDNRISFHPTEWIFIILWNATNVRWRISIAFDFLILFRATANALLKEKFLSVLNTIGVIVSVKFINSYTTGSFDVKVNSKHCKINSDLSLIKYWS